MPTYRCADCDTQIGEDEETVAADGGYPCPNCGKRGEWMRVDPPAFNIC